LLKGRWKTEGTRAFFQEKNNYQKKKKTMAYPQTRNHHPEVALAKILKKSFN
jgi:hypothetical protein